MNKDYCIGIDLGTSNSVIAVADEQRPHGVPLAVTQLAGPSALVEKPLLPSAAYVPHPSEFPEGSLQLPWSTGPEGLIIGSLARDHGALVPERYISSAKSWLCNPKIDRRAPVLPWGSELAEQRYSPLQISAAYLEHLRRSFELSQVRTGAFSPCERAHVVLTVPASFDEAARALTHEAAETAGWGKVTLLEEPQAAFYSWIAEHEASWRSTVLPGDIVLVCDVGGGTADFSLIAVEEQQGALELRRISVGDHILLGGDNMDLALAHALAADLEAAGTVLDHWQLLALIHLIRPAKERLLSDSTLTEMPLSIPARGASLFRSTIAVTLTRERVHEVVLQGFFPLVSSTDLPQPRRAAGLRELGLPYASEPALSKHLARFLTQSLQNVRSDAALSSLLEARGHITQSTNYLRPTAVLFNGGVFNAAPVRERVLSLLNEWGATVRELERPDLDLAVARGAARYGEMVRSGKGLRIRAGTARSFYLGIETSMPAVPGMTPPVKGLCVVPQGAEEGSEVVLEDEQFGLLVGEPAEFRFFSSTTRAGDTAGTVVERAGSSLEESPPLELSLPADAGEAGEVLPVTLRSKVTELGTLELWMQHRPSGREWKLELNLRAQQ